MTKYLLCRSLLLWGLLLMLAAGCAGSKEAEGESPRRQRQVRPQADVLAGPNLAPTSDQVRTIQLYPATDEEVRGASSGGAGVETRLPVLPIRLAGSQSGAASSLRPGAIAGEGENRLRLRLEFDLMEQNGRPLSIYFYHADRTWRRDLIPTQFLDSFQDDNLIRYTPSRATEVPYVHYEYAFPNESIGFLEQASGNYILRVTEQGRENEVLFERAFFLTEQAAPVDLALDAVLTGGRGFPSVQPAALFQPPASLTGNVFSYDVCFVRNGQFDQARCSDRPSLNQQPALLFQLQPETAFEPVPADYFLDLGALQVSNRIAKVDYTTDPYEVVLEPDYARFAGTLDGELLNGQTVVSGAVRDVADADVAAKYVQTRFQYVPDGEEPLRGELLVIGSFNNWQYDPANALQWVAEQGRYEGDVLLKQGYYEYRYVTTDREAARELAGMLPRQDNHYTAFVYYQDIELNTDRLLAVQGTTSR